MIAPKDKHQWYNGWFYGFFIDPWIRDVRSKIFKMVEEGSCILDVGCGTGELVFKLAEKCKYVTGMELSSEMVKYALKKKKKKGLKNVDFYLTDALELSKKFNKKFDYSIISLVLHELSEDERIKIITEMKKVSDNIIIADVNSPFPGGIISWIHKSAEFFAGPNHYRNFISFIDSGGIEKLMEKSGLYENKKTLNNTGIYKIVSLRSG